MNHSQTWMSAAARVFAATGTRRGSCAPGGLLLILLCLWAGELAALRAQDAASGAEGGERPAPLAGQDPHDYEHAEPDAAVGDLSREELDRVDRLYGMIVCKCPDENWTRSLSGCPNACANEQKARVRRRVSEGWSDEKILAEQEQLHGPKAVGRTAASGLPGFLLYAAPFLVLVICTILVVFLLRRLTRSAGGVSSATRGPAASGGPAAPDAIPDEDRKWSERIDRELAEMD